MVDHVFILAGGSGTRLWPASIAEKPKQLMEVQNGKSLLLHTIERALSLAPSGDVMIITTSEQLDGILTECKKLGDSAKKVAVLPEPAGRNTAPAIAAGAAFYNGSESGSDTVLVMPADHLIEPIEAFRADVEAADAMARKRQLVTFGIKPDRPETGYGYIESGDKVEGGFAVQSFREKPDENTAADYVAAGNYYWNSGMFCFRLDLLNDELRANAPDIADLFQRIKGGEVSRRVHNMRVLMESDAVRFVYESAPKISFDYAVMETCKSVSMVPSSFVWNDVGSWDEIAKLNLELQSETVMIEAHGVSVVSDIPVAVCGLDDIIVVIKNGRALIVKKGETQLVKSVVEELKSRGADDIL